MPATDACQPQVIRALDKAGWSVISSPFTLETPQSELYADLQLQSVAAGNGVQEIIVVEVKCFPESGQQFHELYVAVGQYLVYRELLERVSRTPLYLAIPTRVYYGILKEVGLSLITRNQIKLIVIDLEQEEVEQWLE